MPVNQNLATLSDMAYRTAVLIYGLALALSLVYYLKQVGVVELRRAVKGAKALVGAGAPVDVDTTAASEQLPADAQERLRAKIASAEKFAGMTQTTIWLGIIVHAASVILRGLSASRFPWGNLYEYISLVMLVSMAVAAIAISRRDLRTLWPWVLTPVICLMFYGGFKLYAASAPVMPALKSFWFPIHVSTVSLGAGVGLISGVASLLYVIRMANPKGQEKDSFWGKVATPLPSAKLLDAVAYRTAILTLPIFGLGIVFGAIWAESAWTRFWNWDPKETVSFITWILYAAYLHARATSGWRDQKAAWINIAAFATMVFNLFFINLVVSGLHSYAGVN